MSELKQISGFNILGKNISRTKAAEPTAK